MCSARRCGLNPEDSEYSAICDWNGMAVGNVA
jgi:hypothetical protein